MAKLRVIKGGYDAEKKRKKIIAAIMIGFGKMLKCHECGAVYFESFEEGNKCPKCLFLEDKEVELKKISEIERRRMLKEWTGKTHLRHLDVGELLFVLEKLREMGYPYFKKGTLKDAVEDTRRGMIYKIKEVAPFILGENWERRINGFCRKAFGKDALEWLSLYELRAVWGFLRKANKVERRERV